MGTVWSFKAAAEYHYMKLTRICNALCLKVHGIGWFNENMFSIILVDSVHNN